MPLIEIYQIMANNGTMILELKKPIFFVGMMGAGKTAVGRATADILVVPFLDSDAEIEYAANMSISEIFERDGEDYFREKEEQVIRRLCGAGPCVISTGGGAFIRPSVKELLMQEGIAVWIKADLELLWSRVKLKATRPLLQTPDPYGTLKSIFEARQELYAQAHVTVEAQASFTIEQMAQTVIQELRQNGYLSEVHNA